MLRPRFRLNSVWSRVLGTLALVVAPAAVLVVLLAYSLFGAAQSALEATQSAAVSGRAAMLRSWLDSAGRSLANEGFAASYVNAGRCASLADAFLRRNAGFAAIRFLDETANPCGAGAAIDTTSLPPDPPEAADGEASYRLLVVGGKLWVVASYAREGSRATCILVVDDAGLRERLPIVGAVGETQVALVGEKGDVVGAPLSPMAALWLPATFSPPNNSQWRALDRAGIAAAYALAPIEGSHLAVLMRFDDLRFNAARRQLVILCAAQLAMLGLLALAYATTIKRDVVRWIQGIDVAAQARARDPESRAKAPVKSSMPRELRSVAESFNAMADHAVERQQALRSSLAENRALMLEMHHRIKNSLQVIQSYLALIRRASPRSETALLSRIEARVGVIAVAYRLALTPNGMRPISVKPFLEEICAAAVGGLRRPRQRVAYAIEWDGELVVDRAIPLGLGLVEALIAAFSAADAGYIGVELSPDDDGYIRLRVESDAAPTETGLPEKVMRGLSNQLGAAVLAGEAGEIIVWRFQA